MNRRLLVRDGRDRDGAPLGLEPDGRAIGRQAAAWVLSGWRRARCQGGALWVSEYGPGAAEEARRGSVRWVPEYGDDREGR
jgi:hypothetical protein